MSTIYIRGNKNPFEVSRNKAETIRSMWLDKNMPRNQPIEIGQYVGTLGDIRVIDLRTEYEAENRDRFLRDFENDYLTQRSTFLNQSLEEKANDISFFRFVFRVMTNSSIIPEAVCAEAISIQRGFFAENPKRIYTSPILFKSIIEPYKPSGNLNQWESSGLGIIDRCVNTDKRYAR